MQRITPFLWFDDQAEEAASLYISAFANSCIVSMDRYGVDSARAAGRPEGSVMTVTFELDSQRFIALNGGPVFQFNLDPAVGRECSVRSSRCRSRRGTRQMEQPFASFATPPGGARDVRGAPKRLTHLVYLDRAALFSTSMTLPGQTSGQLPDQGSMKRSLS